MTGLAPPVLPDCYGGRPISWSTWEPAWAGTRASCGRPRLPNPCRSCGADAQLTAAGTSGRPGEQRAQAHHCTVCGELRVYWRPDPLPGGRPARLELIVHHTPGSLTTLTTLTTLTALTEET